MALLQYVTMAVLEYVTMALLWVMLAWHYSAVNMLLLRTPECVFSVPQFARPQSLIGYGSRCDKLDQAETRSLLMCFLHIMKTISEGQEPNPNP